MTLIEPVEYTLASGENLLIRNPYPSDAPIILDKFLGVIGEERYLLYEPGEYEPTLEEERQWLAQQNSSDRTLYLVADIAGQAVGGLGCEQESLWRRRHIGKFGLFIEKSWRSRGIGTYLIQCLIDWAQAHPTLEKLTLEVFSHNTEAIRLYRKLGFQEEGRLTGHIKFLSGQYSDELLMGLWVKQRQLL